MLASPWLSLDVLDGASRPSLYVARNPGLASCVISSYGSRQHEATREERNVPSEAEMLKVKDLAVALQVGRNKAYELVNSGAIRSVRIGGRGIRVPREALEEFKAGARAQSA
jgi:excisionase family DNA binding protein